MPLGQTNSINLEKLGVKKVKNNIKSLGIILSKSMKSIIEENFSSKIKKLKSILNMWKSRNLSIKGKITILRSQAIPIILYPASVLYTPPEVSQEVDHIFFDFLWPNKKHHVKKKVLIQSIADGGLKMPCFYTILKANKLTWIKRLISKDNNFTSIAHANARIDNFSLFFKYKMSPAHMKIKPTAFYTQIIEYWNELRHVGKLTCNEILNEPLWLNKDIIIGKYPVHYTDWKNHGISILNDIINIDGTFKSSHDLFLQYNLKVDIMKHNSIKSSISRQWIKTIQEANNTIFKAIERGSIKI